MRFPKVIFDSMILSVLFLEVLMLYKNQYSSESVKYNYQNRYHELSDEAKRNDSPKLANLNERGEMR